MAAKRVTASVIDWAFIAERIPARQKEAFRLFKSQSDKYANKLADLPSTLPKINFEEYRKRVANPAMLAEFEKLYNAVEVPYPKDVGNEKTKIQAEAKTALEAKNQYVAEQNLQIQGFQKVLGKIDSVPPPDQMTMQMFNHYFPESAINPNKENPGFYPQNDPTVQMDTMHLYGRTFFNTEKDRRHLQSYAEWEKEWEKKVAEQEKRKLEKEQQEKIA